MSPDAASTISAIAAAISAGLTLAAVIVAVLSLRGSRQDARDAASRAAAAAALATTNAENDRREEIRPYLTPQLERELLSHGTLNLVVKNWGRTAARDVQVTFTPPPPADVDSLPSDNMMKWLYQAYSTPITLWPPQWRLSNVYRAGQDDVGPVELRITYTGPDGHSYIEDFKLDPEPLLKTTESNMSDPTGSDPAKRQDAWLKRITHALESLVRTVR